MDAVQLLKDLIAIPSENPGGSETLIARYCIDCLRGADIRTEVVAEREDRPNVIATIGDPTRGKTLIWQSHLDTKPVEHAGTRREEWHTDPFEPVERDGALFGLGACDTKGGAAAQLAAVLQIARTRERLQGALIWQGVADEEHGSRYGAELLLARCLLKAEAAVVAEPTNGIPTLLQLGNCWVDVTVRGQAAHGGTPWKGRDAIDAALWMVQDMRGRVSQLPKDPRFANHPIVRIGLIEGGGHAGTVASACRFVTDIRVRPGQSRGELLNLWKETADRCERDLGVQVQLDPFAGGGCEPHAISADSELAASMRRAWRDCTRTAMPDHVFLGGSDARYFARCGTPAIVLGPGDLQHAHAPNEHVPVQEVQTTTELLVALAEDFLGVREAGRERCGNEIR